MSVPLSYFLVAWAILLGFNGIFVFLTLIQALRHGIASPVTYLSTFIFLAVIVVVVGGCGVYFLNTDWSAGVNVLPNDFQTYFFGGGAEKRILQDIPLK
jgi:hypothetical protein